MASVTRRSFVAVAGTVGLSVLSGCSSTGASSAATSAEIGPVKVGTLATEDILPLWVARDEGLFGDAKIDVEIVEFQSATELIAGVASGEVDLAMTDIMVAASLFASGTDVKLEWVTLGATAEQGRFGIMAGPDSDVNSLADLADVPVGVGSNTILEYVMDRLLEDAGVAADQIKVEELQKLPVRYQAMLEGEVKAAALPGTLLALGEANGCRLIADDTQGDNLSQSVMIARTTFAGEGDGAECIERIEDVWNEAVALINTDPEKYRATLVEGASLPDEIADTYPISEYPPCEVPSKKMVEPVLDWMIDKGYLDTSLVYRESTGEFN